MANARNQPSISKPAVRQPQQPPAGSGIQQSNSGGLQVKPLSMPAGAKPANPTNMQKPMPTMQFNAGSPGAPPIFNLPSGGMDKPMSSSPVDAAITDQKAQFVSGGQPLPPQLQALVQSGQIDRGQAFDRAFKNRADFRDQLMQMQKGGDPTTASRMSMLPGGGMMSGPAAPPVVGGGFSGGSTGQEGMVSKPFQPPGSPGMAQRPGMGSPPQMVTGDDAPQVGPGGMGGAYSPPPPMGGGGMEPGQMDGGGVGAQLPPQQLHQQALQQLYARRGGMSQPYQGGGLGL